MSEMEMFLHLISLSLEVVPVDAEETAAHKNR